MRAGNRDRFGLGMSRSPETTSTAVLAVDTGGTFTDLVLFRDGRVETLKVPSTPDDPSRAILAGVAQLLGDGSDFVLLHGSTVATNALLERKGARVALITNRHFEDILEIGRQDRPQLYALVGHRAPPLVARDDRFGIAGRVGPDGLEREPIDPAELADLPRRLAGAEAIAICLLHSYGHPEHEEAVADAVAAMGLPISVSSRLLPEYREYERTSTTVVNAYVGPIMSRYLSRLETEAGARRVAIMGSNGGTLAVERAMREPAHTVLSGPAGGVVGAMTWARRAGAPHIVTFDMGGTSTDVSLCPGRPLHTREFEIDGQPVAVPVIDIHTVGAGGGSLASVDPGGALKVGPESAGAVPGPICYGRGGTRVTVTDAHVWLGRIPVDGFLGGSGSLDRDAIRAPMEQLAAELGTTPELAAEGVLAVADTAMERALRVISVERGFDPADFSLVAFGGAGALHAASLTESLGAKEALIPPDPGLLSAWGILTAPLTRDASRTVLLTATGNGDGDRNGVADRNGHANEDGRTEIDRLIEETLATLVTEARQALEQEGAAPASIEVERWVDARYAGQSFELRVPASDWMATFHEEHERRYGYARHDAAVEAVTLRAVATAPGASVDSDVLEPATDPATVGRAEVIVKGKSVEAARVWRHDLRPGHAISGPALVLDYSATTWVPPEWTVTVDPSGSLRLQRD